MVWIRILLVVTLVVCTLGQRSNERSVKFTHCGGARIFNVTVNPCSREPCAVSTIQSVDVSAHFLSNQFYVFPEFELLGRMDNEDFSLQPNINACRMKGVKCPARTGDLLSPVWPLKLPDEFPAGDSTITFKFKTRNGAMACFLLKVFVV